MAAIIYSTAEIGDAYAPSLNAAFAQIFAESGIEPRVLSPLGGERTLAQEKSVGGTAASDHVKKRAVDIDNQHQLRAWNQARFLAIMAQHGWHNVTEGGAPFPKEPWHFANQSSIPQGNGSTPLPNDDNALLRRQKEDDGMYVKGSSATIYKLFTDANGHPRLRTCAANEAAFARAGGLVTEGNDATLTGLGVEAGWPKGGPEPALPLPRVTVA